MSAERLAKIPEVDLDPNGVFKYVLIRVNSKDDDSYVDIVRGYAWAEYHADIYDRVAGELERDGGLDCECLGGGRIKHDSAAKKIHVYGYSMLWLWSEMTVTVLQKTDVILFVTAKTVVTSKTVVIRDGTLCVILSMRGSVDGLSSQMKVGTCGRDSRAGTRSLTAGRPLTTPLALPQAGSWQ
uniref:14 kDa phosphohistidine phosphatase n=1 Tax=Cyprinus carpio carpio TaxID=630221 RepID=A0A8C1FHM0_CYPCA